MRHSKEAEYYASKWVNTYKRPRKLKKREKKKMIQFIDDQVANGYLNRYAELFDFINLGMITL